MGYESEEGGVIPTGYESERVAGIDHDAKHGDPNERPAFTDPRAAAGLSRRYDSGGFQILSKATAWFAQETAPNTKRSMDS